MRRERETCAYRDAAAETRASVAHRRDNLADERDRAASERDNVADGRDRAASERDNVADGRDRAARQRGTVAGRTEALGIQSRRQHIPVGNTVKPAVAPMLLVVDDCEINDILVVEMLKQRGYQSDVVTDGREALKALQGRRYAAVLMDCQMLKFNGYEATGELRRREQDGQRTPVIAMTADPMRGELDKCLDSGMDAYLAKPLRPDELDRVLRRWAPRANGSAEVAPVAKRTPDEPPAAAGPVDAAGVQRLRSELGSTGPLVRLVDLFAIQTPKYLTNMRNAIQADQARVVRDNAHKLKGGCLTLTATHMAEHCKDLETLAAGGSLEGSQTLVDLLESAFDEAYRALLAEVS